MKKEELLKLQSRNREISSQLGEIYSKLETEKREATEDERHEVKKLERELEDNRREIMLSADEASIGAIRENVDKNKQLREYLKDVRNGKAEREILLNPTADGTTNVTANIAASGAIELTIHEMIPTLHEGLGLPKGLRIVTGVTGNEVWPVSINDAEIEEVGEVAPLTDQVLDFAKITPIPRRIGLTVPISNAAIDNAAFDLMGFVQEKFAISLREYFAKKIYSQAAWTGNKGPFGGLTAGTIELGANAYANILAKVAEFSDKGFFEGYVCISMDRVTEAQLKATPKVAGAAAGFVIENGLCAGYPYTVSHFVNTELDTNDDFVPTADRYLEIGYWEWFALQIHGGIKMSIDAQSQAVAKKNITAVTMNLFVSMTDLSTHINGGQPAGNPAVYPTQAFGLYKIVDEEPTTA